MVPSDVIEVAGRRLATAARQPARVLLLGSHGSLLQRDGRDLARRLLSRADADATLVRHVVDNTDIADAIVGFEEIRRWAGEAVER